MTVLNDFISYPKTDAHNHLNLGMRYNSYTKWAGFYIPNFPRLFSGLDDMHEIIGEYTRPRCKTAKDVEDLIVLAIEDAIADSVAVLEGSVDIGFIIHFNEDIGAFLSMVRNVTNRYADKIDFRPELGMGKTFDFAKIQKWTPECLESGVFKSIDLYGPEVEDGIESFKDIYKQAAQLGIKKKAHVGEFSDASSVRRFVEFFELDEVQHGIGAAKSKDVMRFLADNKIRCNVCPTSNVMLSAVPSLKAHPIRILIDNGVRVSVATDDLMFFDRSVGEQCYDLVNEGVITKAEAFKIMDER